MATFRYLDVHLKVFRSTRYENLSLLVSLIQTSGRMDAVKLIDAHVLLRNAHRMKAETKKKGYEGEHMKRSCFIDDS